MPNNHASWDDYFSDAATAAGESDIAASTAGTPLAPLAQGATFGLAGNLGLLPRNYATQRASSAAYPALEDVGEMGASSALAPELRLGGLAEQLTAKYGPRAAAWLIRGVRGGFNALTGAALGAASTNVSGGDVGENAALGAVGGAVLAPAADLASALAPHVGPNVARYVTAYQRHFGDAPVTRDEMEQQLSGTFQNFVQGAGGIDLRTQVPAIIGADGVERYPTQTLAQRLGAIRGRDYSQLASGAGDSITDAVDSLTSSAMNNGGVIDAPTYSAATQRGGKVAVLSRSTHGLGQLAGGDIRHSLDDALAGNLTGPFEDDYNSAISAHQSAQDRVADAERQLTLLHAKYPPTSNVYGTASSNEEIRKAETQLAAAQLDEGEAASRADVAHDNLRYAQMPGSGLSQEDLQSARDAYQLWRVADAAQINGKVSPTKLASAINKNYKAPEVATASDLASAAIPPSRWYNRFSHAVPFGAGALTGAELLGGVTAPIVDSMVAGMPGAVHTATGALVGGLGLVGLNTLRKSPMMVRAAIAKGAGEINPLLLRQPSAVVAGASLAGASGGQTGQPQHTSWDDYFTTP